MRDEEKKKRFKRARGAAFLNPRAVAQITQLGGSRPGGRVYFSANQRAAWKNGECLGVIWRLSGGTCANFARLRHSVTSTSPLWLALPLPVSQILAVLVEQTFKDASER